MTLRLERGGRELWRSSASGIRPLVEAVLALGPALCGARAYDKVVGLASAKLLVYAGVIEAEAELASSVAEEFAAKQGLTLRASEVVPAVLDQDRTGQCPMEALALEHGAAEAFFEAVVQRLGLGRESAGGT